MDVTKIGTRDESVNVTVRSGSNAPTRGLKKNESGGIGVGRVSDPVSIIFDDAGSEQSAVRGATEGETFHNRFMDEWEEGVASDGLLPCISEEDVKDLEEEGMSLEKYEAEQLERAIERIKSQRAMKEESIERYTERKKQARENVKRASLKQQLPQDVPEYLIDRMLEEDVPITEENVKRAVDACALAERVTDLSDGAIRFLLQNELEPTVRNLYHAKFSGVQTERSSQTETSWFMVESQAEKMVSEAGYEWNEENKAMAKWLFLNGLPVTGETMRAYDALLTIRKENDGEKNAACIVKAMAEGKNPEWATLYAKEEETANRVVDEFREIGEEALRHVYKNGKKANLINLKEANGKTSEGRVRQDGELKTDDTVEIEEEATKGGTYTKEVADVGWITEKRRLEEIRLKMTLQSARTLLKKGIDIDTAPLKELVEELREMENRFYRNQFAEAGERGEAFEIEWLRETTESVKELYAAPAYVLGVRFHENETPTIRNLTEDAAPLKRKLDLAGETYEKLMTAPRKDMGDSIHKAFQNVDDILEDLGFEANEGNRRAVRILAYNEIRIDRDSIQRMKVADSKVGYALKNLHPAVTVRLIKDDVNPLDMPIEQLNERIKDYRSGMGITEEERFSKYLWQLERKEGITEEERESYIGIYRMLNQIQKMDGAAVGALMEMGGELTLNHLMTAVRTLKSGGVKANVDDGFGTAWSVTRKAKTITEQAGTAFTDQTFLRNLAEDALDRMSPDRWKALLEEMGEDLENLSLETFGERLEQVEVDKEGNGEYYREMADWARELLGHSEEEVEFLESNHLPVTTLHIAAVRQMAGKGQNNLKRILDRKGDWEEEDVGRLEEEANGLLEAMGERDALQEQDAKLRDVVLDMISKQMSKAVSFEDMRRLRILEGGVRLRSMLSAKESYEIPLVTEEGVTNVNLTVIRNGREKGKLHIDMDSPVLGGVTADFSMKGKNVRGTVLCEYSDTERDIRESNMKERMQASGYEVTSLIVGRGKGVTKPFFTREEAAESDIADTKSIYRLAKVVIQNIQSLVAKRNQEANIERNVAL